MAIEPLILLNGTTADANDVMALFNEIYSNIANNNIAANAGIFLSKLQSASPGKITVYNGSSQLAAVTMSGAATINSAGVVTLSASGSGGVCPVGSSIPFLDYNGLNTFDPAYWKMQDGTIIGVGAMAGQFTEDMSGRYYVGFGTDGGANIGSTAWAVGAVGNTGSQINIAHTHTENGHTHAIDPPNTTSTSSGTGATSAPSTNASGATSPGTDTQGAHSHIPNTFQFQVASITESGAGKLSDMTMYDVSGNSMTIGGAGAGGYGFSGGVSTLTAGSPGLGASLNLFTKSGSGNTDTQGAHSHTVNSHTHDLGNHTHTGAAHTHDVDISAFTSSTQSDTGMSTSLSSTQDIRPSSIRCRVLLRVQ